MSDKESNESTFTSKEMEYMAAAMISLKEGIPTNAMIDTAKFTKITNLTEGSSQVIWNRLRRKLTAQANASGEGVPATPKTSKETKPRKTPVSKRKTEAGEDGDIAETPSKKPRARKAKAELVKDEKGAVMDNRIKDEEVKDETMYEETA